LDIKVDVLKAYCEGNMGWTIDRVTVKLPNGIELPMRHTHIFQKENDGWKIIHNHVSIAIPNESIEE
jgi:ketosteroid isomerase-like protein